MPVNKDPDGRRWVQAEVEVPGTPDEVWAAIATGPGISAWFVPSEVEERVGGSVISHFSPDGSMDSLSNITAWEPPHRFVADSRDDMGPEDPTVATEWIVEARGGDTCVVRVVHSWFTSKDDWDEQFEGHSYGWQAFFRILRLYLERFRGHPGYGFQLMGIAPEPKDAAWAALTEPLGLAGVTVDQRVSSTEDAPPIGGTVVATGQGEWSELLIWLDRPAPGIAHLVPFAMMGQVFLTIRFFLYGAEGAAALERTRTAWQAWMEEHFPQPTGDEMAVPTA